MHTIPISQFTLGFMYWSGRGTDPDQDTAFKWFLKAAEQDVPEAMYNVAKILLMKDFEKNKDEAIQWLKRSANAGYDTAYDILSDLTSELD